MHGSEALTPIEALGIYERNARHLDMAAMSSAEQALLLALQTGLGKGLGQGSGDAAAVGVARCLNDHTTNALRTCWPRWTAMCCASMAACLAGGTCIALRHGEYRESVDMDFLVSDAAGYRELRQLLTGPTGLNAVVRPGAQPLTMLREVRADQYGVRTVVQMDSQAIKFEIVREARIALEAPGQDDVVCGVGTADAARPGNLQTAGQLRPTSGRRRVQPRRDRPGHDGSAPALVARGADQGHTRLWTCCWRRDLAKAIDTLAGAPGLAGAVYADHGDDDAQGGALAKGSRPAQGVEDRLRCGPFRPCLLPTVAKQTSRPHSPPAPTSATTGNSSPLLTCSVITLMLSCAGSNTLDEFRRAWCGSLRLRWGGQQLAHIQVAFGSSRPLHSPSRRQPYLHSE